MVQNTIFITYYRNMVSSHVTDCAFISQKLFLFFDILALPTSYFCPALFIFLPVGVQ